VTPVYLDAEDTGPAFSWRRAVITPTSRHHAGFNAAILDPHRGRGVLIDNFKLIEHGALREDALRDFARQGPPPVAQPGPEPRDLRAQIAANEKGVLELKSTVAPAWARYRAGLHAACAGQREESVRRVITALKDGEFSSRWTMVAIRVSVRVDARQRSARIDFSGTSASLTNNFNAPRAITTAAVCTCFAPSWMTTFH